MTREEAITVLKGLSDNPLFSDQHRAAFNIAIHDIKARYDWDINNLILINKDNYEPLEQEPKTGHWIESDAVLVMGYSETDNFLRIPAKECSVCHKPHIRAYGMEYCPNCGAKMAESEDT